MEEVDEEDPVVNKIALYTLAHRNYLSTLPYHIIKENKINWGLRKIMKLEDKYKY